LYEVIVVVVTGCVVVEGTVVYEVWVAVVVVVEVARMVAVFDMLFDCTTVLVDVVAGVV